MRRQVLFCVETNKRANTDYRYILSTIDRYYDTSDRQVSYKPIFLESKTKYKDRGKIKEINSFVKNFKGNTAVVYCIDFDDSDRNPETRQLFQSIREFCDSQGYEFVFFNRDVEDVFWGETVNDKDKVAKADQFVRKKMIDVIEESILRDETEKKRHYSNLLNVLDRYFKKKG